MKKKENFRKNHMISFTTTSFALGVSYLFTFHHKGHSCDLAVHVCMLVLSIHSGSVLRSVFLIDFFKNERMGSF